MARLTHGGLKIKRCSLVPLLVQGVLQLLKLSLVLLRKGEGEGEGEGEEDEREGE